MKPTKLSLFRLFPRSIKRRLPATYAMIALLVALSLGGVLLGILSEYYRRQEVDYLSRNANAILTNLTHMIEADAPSDDLQAQVNLFAFLSRTQIDLLDLTDRDNIKSESLVSVVDVDNAQTGIRLIFRQAQGEQFWMGLPEPTLTNIETTTEVRTHDGLLVETIIEDQPHRENFSFDIMMSESGTGDFTHMLSTQEDQIFINQEVGLYGFGLGQGGGRDISQNVESAQAITTPIIDSQGIQQGILRLSHGPVFGTEIVTSVAWGWLLASLFSITLAIIVGTIMSRDVSRPLQTLTATTKQMASGDLSARTTLQRQDEFGTLANAFNDMACQIEATVSTLHHFVSDAAHEINTPITALRTNLELIDTPTTGETLTVQRALEQVKRLEDLTRNLLQLSRLESSVEEEKAVQLNMSDVIHKTVGFFASRADQATIELELSIPEQSVLYTIAPNHIQTALSNVIDNALKFTPAGGRVAVALESNPSEIAIHVRDTGVGIPPDHLPYVFNRFHRASNVSDYAGSGLGLSIVHTVIDRYHGYISIKNLECGTRVSIYLPV